MDIQTFKRPESQPFPRDVYHFRTRLKDALTDFVTAARARPRGMPAWSAYVLPGLGPLALFLMGLDLLIHPLFLGNDSIHNYAHVWYISQEVFHHARIPLRISSLDSGRAVTFPYAFVPYLVGAVLFQLFDNFAVTLMMAAGVVGTVWAAGLARPTVRNPWFLLLVVANPFFIEAVYSFQFATVWCCTFFFLFVWAFERRRYALAATLLWLTVSTHPIVGALAAGVYGTCLLALDRPRVRPLILLSIPVGVALLPIFWMTLLTPSVRENSLGTIVASVADIVPRRGSLLLMPFALTALEPYILQNYRVFIAAAAGIVLATAGVTYQHHHGSYYGALHTGNDVYAAFFASPRFQPRATYRVLEPDAREDGMYRFIRHGAVLSNEFFTESIFRRSWTERQYGCYAAFKRIDYVVIERAYLRYYHRNEQTLLWSLVSAGRAKVTYSDPAGRFTVYDVRQFVQSEPKPTSLDKCRIY